MDYIDLREKCEELEEVAREIENHRMESGKNETKFTLVLASKESELRQQKSNAGIDTLTLMLLGQGDEEVKGYYTKWKFHYNKYKGLEHIEKAIVEKIQLEKKFRSIE